jgi:catechol 2,3-dioxygenase
VTDTLDDARPGVSGPQLAHLGILVVDIHTMTSFYETVFGLRVTDRGRGRNFPRDLVFMSNSPHQHHQLVLASRPEPGSPSSVFQMSFKVTSIDELRTVRSCAVEHGATNVIAMNHGNALSIYFDDPEGNVVECYLDTPHQIAQPHGDPLDLDLPDDTIWQQTEDVCRADPTFLPAHEWARRFGEPPHHPSPPPTSND